MVNEKQAIGNRGLTGMTSRPRHPVRSASTGACYITHACYSLHTHHISIGFTLVTLNTGLGKAGWCLRSRREQDAICPQRRLALELRGARRWRRPWLVLIQGMGFDRHGWEPVLRSLGRHFWLVLVDNRGSGRSDLPPGSFSVADMADDILSVLDRARIRRAHVMGVSLGGMVAQELAVDTRSALAISSWCRPRLAGPSPIPCQPSPRP
ncbi:MAG: hypothetical protein DLM62_05150 [Pseudonocardiales bacterium]|nr:MAG: hypothetical protein DLM62_05150 [Pseudonocardiales bacterium]